MDNHAKPKSQRRVMLEQVQDVATRLYVLRALLRGRSILAARMEEAEEKLLEAIRYLEEGGFVEDDPHTGASHYVDSLADVEAAAAKRAEHRG